MEIRVANLSTCSKFTAHKQPGRITSNVCIPFQNVLHVDYQNKIGLQKYCNSASL